MKLFTYSAKSADGRYNTKYGDVVAADEAEAKKKVAAEFEYKVNVDLQYQCEVPDPPKPPAPHQPGLERHYDYRAYSVDGTKATESGYVMAINEDEAIKKIKQNIKHPVRIELDEDPLDQQYSF